MNQVPNRAGEISRGFDGNCECFVTCGGLGKSVCSKCKYVNYCSKNCQKSDFKRHKSFCSEHMPLLEYCTRGLTDKVIQAIAAGADVNAQILIPMPKHFPVPAGWTGSNKVGMTPLGQAIQFQRKDVVKVLLENGADPNMPGNRAVPAMYYAAELGDLETVQLLLDNGATPSPPTACQTVDQAYLAFACQRGHIDTVKALVKAGAIVDQRVNHEAGDTPLYVAAKHNKADIVEYLISVGADVNASKQKGNPIGLTPLMVTAQGSSTLDTAQRNIMNMLIKAGADVNRALLDDGWQAIHMYTETNNLEAVQILLAGGADHLNRTKDGHTPLDITLIVAQKNRSLSLTDLETRKLFSELQGIKREYKMLLDQFLIESTFDGKETELLIFGNLPAGFDSNVLLQMMSK